MVAFDIDQEITYSSIELTAKEDWRRLFNQTLIGNDGFFSTFVIFMNLLYSVHWNVLKRFQDCVNWNEDRLFLTVIYLDNPQIFQVQFFNLDIVWLNVVASQQTFDH